MSITMPWNKDAAAGLVIRMGAIEFVMMRGKTVAQRVRVPFEIEYGDRSLAQGLQKALLAQAIKRALDAAGFTGKKVVVSIPTRDVLFRFFGLPMLPKPEWDSAIQFEGRKYVPFKTEDLVWDYVPISPGHGEKLEVIFAAVQRASFQTIQESLAAAGVTASRIEPRTVSLARLVPPPKRGETDRFVCLVDIEEDAAHLAIVKDGLPYLARDVNLSVRGGGPARIETAGAQAPTPAAAPGPETPELSPENDDRLQRLLNELQVSINFFTREHPSATVSVIYLFGEDKRVEAWRPLLAAQLRCEVEPGHRLVSDRVGEGVPLSFASAVGLLVGEEIKASSIDFLRRGAAKVVAKPTRLRAVLETVRSPQAMSVAGVTSAILLLIGVMGAQWVKSQQHAYDQLVAGRSHLVPAFAGMTEEELQPIKSRLEAHLAWLKQMVDDRMEVTEKLDAMARTVPEGVWLTGIAFEHQTGLTGKSQHLLVLRGACYLGQSDAELSAIQAFSDRIKRHPAFAQEFASARLDEVRVLTDAEQQHTYRGFQMTCNSERRL